MNDYDDDPFAATRMSLGDHVEELRLRLWKALAGFGVAFVLGFFLSPTVLRIVWPRCLACRKKRPNRSGRRWRFACVRWTGPC